MGVVGRLLMISRFVMFCSFSVVLGRMRMMFSSVLMVIGSFL